MKIETNKNKHGYEYIMETTTITLSSTDLENILRDFFNKKNFKVKDIQFNAEYNFVEDSWGMNSHIVSRFKNAIIEMEPLKIQPKE